jgi:AcrR family transcriptional regulator
MPKRVDHESRRQQVAKVAYEVMESVGPERTSIREIARRGGFSHSLLSHYFKDSDEVFGFAYKYLTESILERIRCRAMNLAPGIDRLYAAFDESCPYRLGVGAVATLSFWAHAVGNEHNRLMQKQSYSLWRRSLRGYIVAAMREGHIKPCMNVEDLLNITIMFLDGLCVAGPLEPAKWPPGKQVRILNRFFVSNFLPTRPFGASVPKRQPRRTQPVRKPL